MCHRLAAASDKVYQLFANGRRFSPGIPASSTPKTGRHEKAEILLQVALSTINHSTLINDNQIHVAEHRFNLETHGPSE